MMSKPAALGPHPGYVLEQTPLAINRMDAYCANHPRSPSALHRPRLLLRGQLWIALLGSSIEEGIVGIGPSVEAALRAFDSQYLAGARTRARDALAE